MQFGEFVRKARGLMQQTVADRISVSVSYISKVENGKLHFGDFPSEKFICKLAAEIDADEDAMLLLADKVPASIRERILQLIGIFFSAPDHQSTRGEWLIEGGKESELGHGSHGSPIRPSP